MLDHELRVIRYSQAEQTLAGLSAEDVLRRRFFEDIAPCMVGEQISEWCLKHLHADTLVYKSIDWLLRLRVGDQMASLDMCAGKGRVVILIDRTVHV